MTFLGTIGRIGGGLVTAAIPGGLDDALLSSLTRRSGTTTGKKAAAIEANLRRNFERPTGAVPGNFSEPTSPCPGLLQVRGPGGTCVDLTAALPGGDPFITPRQEVFSSQALPFGQGVAPAARTTTTLMCPEGMVLSKNDICFDKRNIPKKDRKWNPGRPPLLTGGERNAITKAAAAARKIQRTEKQLQKLGMLKKPSKAARRAPVPRARQLGAGHPDHTIVVG